MVCLSYDDFRAPVALNEVRIVPVHALHLLPLPIVVHFEDAAGRAVVWTTDRDYFEMNARTGALKPSQYTLLATAPTETVGEYERRCKLRLVLVQIVRREERKGGGDD